MAHVAAAVLPGDHRGHRTVPCVAQRGGHLQDGDGPPRTDIDRREAVALRGRCSGGEVGGGHVVDVDEVTHLPAVLENPWWITLFQRRAEDRRHPGIGGVARHAGAVDVVVAQRHHRAAGGLRPRQRVVLLRGLAGRVQAARPQRGILVDEPPAQLLAAERTAVLEEPRRRGRRAAAAAGRPIRAPDTDSDPARRPPSTTPAPDAAPRRRTSAPAAPWWRNRCGCRRRARRRRPPRHPPSRPGDTPGPPRPAAAPAPRRRARRRCRHPFGSTAFGPCAAGSSRSTPTTSWPAARSAASTRDPMKPAAPVSSTLMAARRAT